MRTLNRKILVVEDNEDSRMLIVKILSREGYDIAEAESGEDAVRLAGEEKPDLILMDVGLVGMDGLEATARIKKNPETASIPVIALTAYAMDGDKERTLGAGCDGYISKPIDVRQLPREVEHYLKGQGS